MEARKLEGEGWSRDKCLPTIWLAGCFCYLKILFLLSVHRVHVGHHGDKLDGSEWLVSLLPDSAFCEHLFDHLHDLSLCEAVRDFR